MNLANELYEKLLEIPLIDVHTHLDPSHLSARGLHDILLYHMVISDLYSSGCPSGNRLSEDPDEEEKISRIEEALTYLGNIRNTSCFWGLRSILKDLYDWDDSLNLKNWKEADKRISEKNKDPEWAFKVLNKAGVKVFSTEYSKKTKETNADTIKYSLEWAFFARTQWRQFDTALVELEYAWSQNKPSKPLPVTLDPGSLNLDRRIESLSDVHEAINHYCCRIPYDEIISVTQHFSTDIDYRLVSDKEMENALANRKHASQDERDVYANYIMEAFLNRLENMKKDVLLQFSCGAEPLPYETGSKMRTETVFKLAEIFQRHPGIRFQAFLASEHQNQAFCTLAREIPNLSLAGYWWHNFFPGVIRKIITDRLDMLPLNKQVGFFSDAYCVEWAYAKSLIVRKQMSVVLAEKVAQGQYSAVEAIDIARKILFEEPGKLIGAFK